jgi:lipoprotein NlpI
MGRIHALWLYIAEARSGKNGRGGLETRSQWLDLNKWPGAVVDYYRGKIPEKTMYAAAESPNAKTRSEQICEANFYAAEAKLLEQSTDAGIPLLRVVEKDCLPHSYAAQAARAELKRLGSKP